MNFSITYQVISDSEITELELLNCIYQSIEENELINLDAQIKKNYSYNISERNITGFDLILETIENDGEIEETEDVDKNEEFPFFGNIVDVDDDLGVDRIFYSPIDPVLQSFVEILKTEKNYTFIDFLKENINVINILKPKEEMTIFKFHDKNLFNKLDFIYSKIFETEMKLREILTFIFVDTYKIDYYNLLKDLNLEKVKTDKLSSIDNKDEYLAAKFENEFFYMQFSDYKKLRETKNSLHINNEILPLIQKSNNIVELNDRLLNMGVSNREYVNFLSNISNILGELGDLRNCVAHGRNLTEDEIDNYRVYLTQLNTAINSFWNEY